MESRDLQASQAVPHSVSLWGFRNTARSCLLPGLAVGQGQGEALTDNRVSSGVAVADSITWCQASYPTS